MFNGATLAISLLTLPIVTRLMTPAEFGVASLVLSVAAFLIPLISFSADSLLPVQRASASVENFVSIRSATYVLSGLLTFACVLILVVGATLKMFGVVMILAPVLCFSRALRAGQQSVMVYDCNVRGFGLSNMMLALLSMGLAYGLLTVDGSASSRLFSLVLAEILVVVFLMRAQPLRVSFAREHVVQVLRFGIPLAVASLPAWLINEYGKFYLAGRLGMSEVGVLSLAFQLGFVYMQFSAALNNTFSRSFFDSPRLAFSPAFTLKIFSSMSLVALGCGVGLKWGGHYVFDQRYLGALNVMEIILAGYFFQSLTMIPSLYFSFFNRTYSRLAAISIAAFLNVIFLVTPMEFVSPIYKVAFGFFLSMFSYFLASYIIMYRDDHARKKDQ